MENNKLNYEQSRSVRELSRAELDYLRCQVACEKYDDTQACPNYISDEEVFEYFEGVAFVWDDFPCHEYKDEEVNS